MEKRAGWDVDVVVGWARVVARRCWSALLCVAPLVVVAPEAGAFDQYSVNRTSGNCADCHGPFRGTPYTSRKDVASWGKDLHDGHRFDMLDNDCNACHLPTGRFPVELNSSVGGFGLPPISCVGCHGRTRDGNVGLFGVAEIGAGLRQHHTNAGETICIGCHPDADPATFTTAAESEPPPYYFTPDASHPSKPTNACNDPDGTEAYFGQTGLDNDGNLDEDRQGNTVIGARSDLACEPTRVYWADYAENTIRRMLADGTGVELLVASAGNPTDLTVDEENRHIYWCATASNSIMRSDLDGGNVVTIISLGFGFLNGIELDPDFGHLYVTNFGTGQIVRMDLDGGNLTVVQTVTQPRGIALDLEIDPEQMYYESQANLQILRSDLDGANAEILTSTGPVPHDLAIDPFGAKVYWVELDTHLLLRMDLDGTNFEPLVSTGFRPRGVALQLDVGEVWWTKPGTPGTISRAGLDGSSPEDVLVGAPLVDPWGIRVVPVPEPPRLVGLLAGVALLLVLTRRADRLRPPYGRPSA